MAGYEYAILTVRVDSEYEYVCQGEALFAADEQQARASFKRLLMPDLTEFRRQRDEEDQRVKDRYQAAVADWQRQRDAIRSSYSIELVEEVEKRRVVIRERVTMPGGGARTFEQGKGQAWVNGAVSGQAGQPPKRPPERRAVSDEELLDELVHEMTGRPVSICTVSVEPGEDHVREEFHGDVPSRVIAMLNRMGADGWQLADVSEDRVIADGSQGPSTKVVAARYTLMRETV